MLQRIGGQALLRALQQMTTRQEKITYIYDHKRKIGCEECKTRDPDILEYHHILEHTKIANISDMVTGPYTLEDVIQEIQKCMVLCSSHHAKRHREQELEWRLGKDE
jgi:hypothetical protein